MMTKCSKTYKKWMVRRLTIEAISVVIGIVGVVLFFTYATNKKEFWDFVGILMGLVGGSIWKHFNDESLSEYMQRKVPKPKTRRCDLEKFWLTRKVVVCILGVIIIGLGEMIMKFSEYPDIGFFFVIIGIILGVTFYQEEFKDYKIYRGWWW